MRDRRAISTTLHATALVTCALLAAAPVAVAQGTAGEARREGRLVLTGGTLDFRDPEERRQARPAPLPAAPRTARQRDWLDDVVETLFGSDTPPKHRPRVQMARPPTAAAPRSGSTITTGTITAPRPVEPAPKSEPVTPPQVAPSQPMEARHVEPPRVHPGDAEAQIVREAARAQTRVDLIKLELARRTYDEPKIAGQPVFTSRPEWRVLERARDAWTDAELSASRAAGFEANAYVNDVDKKIVVAIAGTQDLRRDFIEADIWRALIQSQSPQHFFLSKSYIRSVMKRYQAQGYQTECVGHSLGGAACAYAASELGIRAIVVNPISAGPLPESARLWITNYVVDGDIAAKIYAARGNGNNGDIQRIADGSDAARVTVQAKYGPLAGPILIIRDLQNSVKVHQIDRALDLIAAHAGTERVK
jgi:hypothetical protein